MIRSGVCEFSPCRRYRYVLIREWETCEPVEPKLPGSFLLVIGLNPSTADETQNDPTITRCIGFARKWGFRKLVMMNIFAFRATQPWAMKNQKNPIGAVNDLRLLEIGRHCHARGGIVLAAWGTHGAHGDRGSVVQVMMAQADVPLFCLGRTSRGHPKHPLYVAGDTQPIPFAFP